MPQVSGSDAAQPGVVGDSTGNDGVLGISHAEGKAGVAGVNDDAVGNGIYGHSELGNGVIGYAAQTGSGVAGDSRGSDGVLGISHAEGKAGVAGVNDDAVGNGIYGHSKLGNGVLGMSDADSGHGIVGLNTANGNGVYGHADGAGAAGYFEGNVVVTGDLILTGADYAEALPVAEQRLDPGMVAVLDDDGRLRPCGLDYDTRVAGVVSGAGGVKAALVLDRAPGKVPIALMGTAYVWCDARRYRIRPGDLLTTSALTGHARRVEDRTRALGSVIGKAIGALDEGTGLVRVLVSTR